MSAWARVLSQCDDVRPVNMFNHLLIFSCCTNNNAPFRLGYMFTTYLFHLALVTRVSTLFWGGPVVCWPALGA